jgi:hypothetical protein
MTFNFRAPFLNPPPINYSATNESCDPSARQVQQRGGLVWQLGRFDGTGKVSLKFREFHCPSCGHITRL